MYPLEVRIPERAQANPVAQVGPVEPVPASPQARYGPEQEAGVSSRPWSWLAIGSGIAAVLALFAAAGTITGVLRVPAMRSGS
jgi:hypothetical protein